MSDTREEAVARQHLCAFPTELEELSILGRVAKVQEAGRILATADAADKAAGIYRVSLEAAIDAAAKALFERTRIGHWEYARPETQEDFRDNVRDVVTTAITGGAL